MGWLLVNVALSTLSPYTTSMTKKSILSILNSLKNVPKEQWPSNIKLKAVSANSDGIVNSGILSNGVYFHLKHEFIDGAFTGQCEFVLG